MKIIIHYRWVILGLVVYCQLAQAFTYQGVPPILGILVAGLGISYAQAGGLMSLYSLPRIFMALPSGFFVDSYGTKKVGSVSLLALSLGMGLFAVGSSYAVLGLGRLLAGTGTTFLLVVTLHAITSWFREKEIGLSMGLYNMAMPLGTIITLNFGGVFAAAFGWRATISVIFMASMVGFILFLFLYREKNSETGIGRIGLALFKALRKTGWGIWLVSSMWGLHAAALIPYFTFAPDYFTSLGVEPGRAGLLASYPMWASFLLSPVVGLLIDRIGRRRLLVLVGFIVGGFLYYLIPRYPAYSAIFAVCIGISAATIQPTPIFSLAAEVLSPSVKGVGFGILTTFGAIGMALGPYITGLLRDFSGGYVHSFNAMAIISLLGVVPALLFRRLGNSGEPARI